jgi:aspartate/tyrosine/aromatic aminotransferase
MKLVIRAVNYITRRFSGTVVATVLNTTGVGTVGRSELAEMRVRIKSSHEKRVADLKAAGVRPDMSFIRRLAYSAIRG